MGMTKKVQRQIQKALKQIGDLGTDVIIRRKENPVNYDFEDSSITPGIFLDEIVVPGFQEAVTRDSGTDAYSIKTTVLLDSQTLDGPLDDYDQVVLRGHEWTLAGTSDDGFLTTLDLRRAHI